MEIKNLYELGGFDQRTDDDIIKTYLDRKTDQLQFEVYRFKHNDKVFNGIYMFTLNNTHYWLGFIGAEYQDLYILTSTGFNDTIDDFHLIDVDTKNDESVEYVDLLIKILVRYHMNLAITEQLKGCDGETAILRFPVVVQEDGTIRTIREEE